MSTVTTHRIHICTKCRARADATSDPRGNETVSPGARLISRLQIALDAKPFSKPFELSGVECMAGCNRPCTVAYQADGKAGYLFGDIDPDGSLDALVRFAHQYAELETGWCSATERPIALLNKTLARIPAFGAGEHPKKISSTSRDGR
ncbi:DUF1636 family protein [Roseibium sp.]|uniref:DUF1636 family protein n=1 Tax=Roseibium sp. TaxID=1936156 RepID=UPI003B50F944